MSSSSKTRLRLELLAVAVTAGGACTATPTKDGPAGPQGSAQSFQAEADADGGQSTDAGDGGAAQAAGPQIAQRVGRTDIVSDSTQPGAMAQDPTLINAWGLAFNPSGLAWVAANGSGIAEIYSATGSHALPSVTIPAPSGASGPSAPTGQAFNGDSTVLDGDRFIFVTEDGTIAGWQPSDAGNSTSATMRVDNSGSGAVYKGVALAMQGSRTRLFAANFHAGKVEAFDSSYTALDVPGGFRDKDLPHGFAPFNVAAVQGGIVVTYAQQDQDKEDDVDGPGLGYVDLFDFNGELVVRLISQGALNAPWGIATSSTNFGDVPFRMYVGNFGDGTIQVYRLENVNQLASLVHEGQLGDATGQPLVIDGLWSLAFGPDTGGFSSQSLYFTAGPNDEQNGVFGKLDVLP